MSTLTAPSRLKLRDTEDFLSLTPYLLGYQPDGRLVAIVLSDRQVAVTAAMPLDMFADPWSARDALMNAVDQVDGARVMLSAWSPDDQSADDALGMVEAWLGPERVLDSVIVCDGEWWSRLGCCQGTTDGLAHGRAAAEAVMAGLGAAGTREDAVRVVDGPARPDRAAFEAADERWLERQPGARETLELVARLVRTEGELPLGQVADLVMAVQCVGVRDAVWLAMDIAHARDHLRLWQQVVAVTPQEWALVPVLLLGCASWVAGQGALMVACVERALDLDPRSSLARLLSEVNRQALPPQAWEASRASCMFGLPVPEGD